MYFILGILFIQFGLPLLEGLTTVLLTALEGLKGYFGTIVAKYNAQIKQSATEGGLKQQIGFSYEEEENE